MNDVPDGRGDRPEAGTATPVNDAAIARYFIIMKRVSSETETGWRVSERLERRHSQAKCRARLRQRESASLLVKEPAIGTSGEHQLGMPAGLDDPASTYGDDKIGFDRQAEIPGYFELSGQRHRYDALIWRERIALEVDGCWYHGCKKCFSPLKDW